MWYDIELFEPCYNRQPANIFLFAEVEFNEDTDGFLVDKPPEEYLDDLMLGAYTGEYWIKSVWKVSFHKV